MTMWYQSTVTVAGTAPVTLSDAKTALNVDSADFDPELDRLINAAWVHVERVCGARFAVQTIVAKCDSFADMARLSEAPVQSITSIQFVDTEGDTQTLSTDVYELRADGLEASVVLKYGQVWPVTRPGSRIVMTAVVGVEPVDPPVAAAMLSWVAEAFENRENRASSPRTFFDDLLTNYRRGA